VFPVRQQATMEGVLMQIDAPSSTVGSEKAAPVLIGSPRRAWLTHDGIVGRQESGLRRGLTGQRLGQT